MGVRNTLSRRSNPTSVAVISRIITSWSVEKWKHERENHVAKPTVNRELTILKHMFKMGMQWGLMQINPAASVAPFPVQEGRFRYLGESEIPGLLDACEKQVTSRGFTRWSCLLLAQVRARASFWIYASRIWTLTER
jgi:site-specific recombinase XerD